jgi:hypothetical protein
LAMWPCHVIRATSSGPRHQGHIIRPTSPMPRHQGPGVVEEGGEGCELTCGIRISICCFAGESGGEYSRAPARCGGSDTTARLAVYVPAAHVECHAPSVAWHAQCIRDGRGHRMRAVATCETPRGRSHTCDSREQHMQCSFVSDVRRVHCMRTQSAVHCVLRGHARSGRVARVVRTGVARPHRRARDLHTGRAVGARDLRDLQRLLS